jgi:hypothetical protein
MTKIRKSAIFLVLVLLATPVISGQDLSKYRKFALGTSVTALSKQIGQESRQANLIHASPVLIQELTYWPLQASYSANLTEPASQILFSFYNGALYRIVVTYDQNATAGLTNEDMVQALSARYGAPTRFNPEIDFPAHDAYMPAEKVVARWEDSENSVNLVHSSSLNTFGLAVFSKGLDTQVNAALVAAAKSDQEQAPQREIDRQKKEADDLDAVRQKNKKAFHP